jgi:hypothetical protein
MVSFQSVLYVRKRVLEIGNRPSNSDFSNNRSFRSRQTCLFGTHGHDQIEAGLLPVVIPTDTEGKVQRSRSSGSNRAVFPP